MYKNLIMLTNIILLQGQGPLNTLGQDFLASPKNSLPTVLILTNTTVEEIIKNPFLSKLPELNLFDNINRIKDNNLLDLPNIIFVGFNRIMSLFPYSYLSQIDYLYILKVLAGSTIFFGTCYVSYKTYLLVNSVYQTLITSYLNIRNLLNNAVDNTIDVAHNTMSVIHNTVDVVQNTVGIIQNTPLIIYNRIWENMLYSHNLIVNFPITSYRIITNGLNLISTMNQEAV
mgnify:FL=1